MSVLQSVNGNQDRAIEVLLGMSDPDYCSEAPAPFVTAPQPPTFSQEELDEQFARQLALQDQQQQTEQWIQAHGGSHAPPAVYRSNRPTTRPAWSPQPTAQQGQDRTGEFQDQFNKFAETGKKTIGNIFSKVKAKLQEFEQGRPAGQPSGSQQQGWTSPPGGDYNPPPELQHQQPAYYEPGPRRAAGITQTLSSPAQAYEGYDVSTPIPSTSPFQTTTSQLQPEPSPQSIGGPPPQSGPTLDGGKLGLLPKRPVTLLRDPASPNTASGAAGTLPTAVATTTPVYHDDYEDDDDLEYAENPFESEPASSNTK
ncbi:hypothetical protein BDN70DRAFT_872420 [Pholiota conissans]|uniref:CUE domain-containing protein n=1 Tax=Pholiota conissans TaxID=109636 RepID=A0A9P5ZBL5_9AGAR|nr:hypothetical protein BDN70DRAFT_872420 [Pholiota conissans]